MTAEQPSSFLLCRYDPSSNFTVALRLISLASPSKDILEAGLLLVVRFPYTDRAPPARKAKRKAIISRMERQSIHVSRANLSYQCRALRLPSTNAPRLWHCTLLRKSRPRYMSILARARCPAMEAGNQRLLEARSGRSSVGRPQLLREQNHRVQKYQITVVRRQWYLQM